MRTRPLPTIVLVVCMVMVLTWAVGAQKPELEWGASSFPPPLEAWVGAIPNDSRLISSVDAPDQAASETAVSVGEPGLSFRYVETFGTTGQPYISDTQHLNYPTGLFIDTSDNLYITEEHGARMLKYRTSDGANLLSIGTAGLRALGNDTFYELRDVTVDGSGNIWVTDDDRVVQYDSNGVYQQQIGESGSGNDNSHFYYVGGVAFDSAGRLYIADNSNHRIQVYTFTVSGTPVYSATIGETSVSGSDNSHFVYPHRIAIDSSDRLYVDDQGNFRVQRCTYASTWSCNTFHGTGSLGSGSNELNWAWGIGIDGSDNVYIADTGNDRIKKCDSGGSCSIFATGFRLPTDVVADSSGNVYVCDGEDHVIERYNSGGTFVGIVAGTQGVPYLTDDSHFNDPVGVAVDGSGNIHVSEGLGYRAVKLNGGGSVQWAIGTAGVWGSDNVHFGGWREGLSHIAADDSGNVYVADPVNNRIQIYDSGGSYMASLGSGWGTGDYQFQRPYGVVVDNGGNIYVADVYNHRVQIYDTNRQYQATLGESGVSGDDNAHFSGPYGVTVDDDGSIYVADTWNQRVQVYDSSLTYAFTLGETDVWGNDFAHFSSPHDVAVDAKGQIYVADRYNHRIQVFDSSGAYLTTIGGMRGSSNDKLDAPTAVSVDNVGSVYVADRGNHCIQKFTPGVPEWRQTNINGFGDQQNWGVLALAPFYGQLYAGIFNVSGAQLWRTAGSSWTPIMTDGFGNANNSALGCLVEFKDYLYAGAGNSAITGGEIWRSSNGLNWTRVVSQGFGDPSNGDITTFAVFSDTLYASTYSYTSTHGTEIWRSSTGDSSDWTRVVTNGFGDADNNGAFVFKVFNDYLYVSTRNFNTGAALWRTNDGVTWAQVNTHGFGDPYNLEIQGLESFNGYLYAGTTNYIGSDNPGAELWRCQQCDNSDWEQVPIAKGFGNIENRGFDSMITFDNALYAVIGNSATGMEIWRTGNGVSWEQMSFAGFGDSNNMGASATVFKDSFYVGTWNSANGGEIWMYLQEQVYLPLVVRQFP